MVKTMQTILAFFVFIPSIAIAQNFGAWSPYTFDEDRSTSANITKVRKYTKPINYIDANGFWKRTDARLRASVSGFFVRDAPYSSDLPLKANGEFRFTVKNKFDYKTRKKFQDSELEKIRTFIGAAPVDGQFLTDSILYPNALPLIGASLQIRTDSDKVQYLIRWDEKPICAESIDVRIGIRYNYNGKRFLPPNANGQLAPFSVSPKNSPRSVYTPRAMIWDSGEKSTKVEFSNTVSLPDGVHTKSIPCSFFDDAVYPVFSDDVDQFFSSASDGKVAVSAPSLAWVPVIDQSSADNFNDTDVSHVISRKCGSACGGTFDTQNSKYVSFYDLSTITGATITSAVFNFTAVSKTDGDNESLHIVSSTAVSPLVAGDYSLDGADSLGLIDISVIATDGTTYNEVPFTSTGGLSYLQGKLGGNVTISTSFGRDLYRFNPTAEVTIEINSADASGTASDPFIEIEFTPAGTPPSPETGTGGINGSGAIIIYRSACNNFFTNPQGGIVCTEWDTAIEIPAIKFGADMLNLSLVYIALYVLVVGSMLLILWRIMRWFWDLITFRR